MQKIADFFRDEPWMVVSIAIVGLVGGLVGLILAWGQFYREYLAVTVSLPGWLLLAAFLLLCVTYFFLRGGSYRDKPGRKVIGKTFGREVLQIDGKHFQDCIFDGTELVFRANAAFGFNHCRFISPKFSFAGSAQASVAALAGMYKDPAFRPIVDGTWLNIKGEGVQNAAGPRVGKSV